MSGRDFDLPDLRVGDPPRGRVPANSTAAYAEIHNRMQHAVIYFAIIAIVLAIILGMAAFFATKTNSSEENIDSRTSTLALIIAMAAIGLLACFLWYRGYRFFS